MQSRSVPQFAIVQGDSAQDLTDKLNKEMWSLAGKGPEVTINGLMAVIRYSETERIFDEPEDAIAVTGLDITCQDCPFFKPIRNRDGSLNRVVKSGKCEFSKYGKAYRDGKPCMHLIETINRGEVRLCLAE